MIPSESRAEEDLESARKLRNKDEKIENEIRLIPDTVPPLTRAQNAKMIFLTISLIALHDW